MDEATGVLARLVEQASVIHIKPSNVLAIGRVTAYNETIAETLAQMKQQAGVASIWLFENDIDIQALDRAEQERITTLEQERDLLAHKVRAIQQEVDFFRHVSEDEAAPADKREGLKRWCELLQAALDGRPTAGAADD